MAILVSAKIEFKIRILLEFKKTFDNDKWVNLFKNIKIFNEYVSNNRISKYMEQSLIELKGNKHMAIVRETDIKAVRMWITQVTLLINLTYVVLEYVTQTEQNTNYF